MIARIVLVLVLVAQSAVARPRPRPDMDGEPFERFEVSHRRLPRRPPFQCPQNSDWGKLKRCLETKDKVVILRDLPNAKLVKLHGKVTTYPTMFLYMRVQGQWLRTSFYGNMAGELLSVAPIRDGALRLDMGESHPTAISLDEVSSTPAVLRRKTTFICAANGSCVSIVTACDMSVRGRAYWWFRGKPVWDGTSLKVKGDTKFAGQHCQVQPSLLTTVGDPL